MRYQTLQLWRMVEVTELSSCELGALDYGYVVLELSYPPVQLVHHLWIAVEVGVEKHCRQACCALSLAMHLAQ